MYTSRVSSCGIMSANRPLRVGSAETQGTGSVAPPVRSGKEGPVAGVTGVPSVVVTGKAVKVAPPSPLV